LEDFIDQEVTSLFIIELEDIGNFSKELRLRISSTATEKEKASTLEEERFHCQVEEIEVYESSSHEERKSLPRHRKERTFSLHSTTTNHANDETEEKRRASSNFFTRKIRRQRISTCE